MGVCTKTLQYDEVTRRVWCDTCGHEAFIPIKAKRPVKRTPTIAELTAERDKYRDACERLIDYYGEMDFKISGRYDTAGDEVGLFARQVKAELDI